MHKKNLNVGADLRVCPPDVGMELTGAHAGAPLQGIDANRGASISEIMQWFKTMTTNAYIRGVKENNWMAFAGHLWQRNYYEHVIRDEQSYLNIREYIIDNPRTWQDDEYYV